MNQYKAVLDKVTKSEKTIGWERCTVELWADDEDEARKIIAEEEPDYEIHSITCTGTEED